MKKLKLLFVACALLLGVNSASAKDDVTSTYLKDADLSSLAGWGDPGRTAWKTDGAVNVVEFWNWSTQFSFAQKVELPAGYYRLAVNAFYRNSWGGDGTNNNMAWIFAGGKTQNVIALNSMNDLAGYAGSNDLYRAATAFSQGKFSNEFDFNVTGEGTTTIEIGFKGTCPNGGWCILGPVTLWEYTVDDYIEDYRTKVTEAQSLYDAKMSAGVLAALKAAVVDEETLTTIDAVFAQVEIVKTAINNANASIASYAALKTAIDKANNHTYNTPAFPASVTIYNNAVSTAQGVYDAAEVDDCSAAINALTDGMNEANANDYSIFANDYAFDYSSLLDKDMTKWASTNYVTMTANEHWNGLTNQKYYEQSGAEWGQSSWSHAASETTTLPAGKYVMSITARASADVTSTMSVKVGDNEAVTVVLPNKGATGRGITTDGVGSYADGTYANSNGRGWEYRFIAFTVAEESPVTISFSSSTNVSHNWVSLASPLLKGDAHPNQIKLNQVKTLVATLTGYESSISAETYATFADHIAAANDATEESTDLDDIIAALQSDIATAQAEVADIAAARADFQTMKDYADALVAVATDNETANSTLESAISTQATAAEANSVDEINAATSALKEAMTTYAGEANPVGDGAQFDLTFMLTNPDVTDYWTGAWNVQPKGWYNEQNGGNFQVMANEGMGPGGEVFMEYWSETAANNGFVLCQKVTLPEGTYKMTGRVGVQQYDANGTTTAVTFSANETDGTSIAFGALADAEVEFVNTAEQEVRIGLKAQAGNNARWMGINKIHLYKVPASVYEIDENVNFTQVDKAGDVTVKRTFKAGQWNTFVVPFQISNVELTAAFGDVEVAEFTGETANGNNANSCTVNFTKMATPAIAPNKPVLLKTSTTASKFVFEARTLSTGTPEVAGKLYNFVGSYDATTTVAAGDYFFSGGKLWQSEGTTTIKGTRAYLKANSAQGARIADFVVDDEQVTAIDGLTVENTQNGNLYNLNGQRVTTPKKGLYIREGKKFVVK